MVELFEQDLKTQNRHSSKGNQLKWRSGDIWYKADYTGYEGLSEYVISELLVKSSLKKGELVAYETEQIHYGVQRYLGCRSQNFLPKDMSLITLERLFQNMYGESLSKSVYQIEDYENRLKFLVDQTIRMTGLRDFCAYMSKLLTIDAVFLNEDRHMHNIAVLMDDEGDFHYCPFFDHGAGLLADTTMDYPLSEPVGKLLELPEAKTFCRSFDEQLDIAEQMYGQHIQFDFTMQDVEDVLHAESCYSQELKKRIAEILRIQMRKYKYLFK